MSDTRQFTSTWNSGSSTTATLQIVNLNIADGGNDFALDDIVLRTAGDCVTPTSTATSTPTNTPTSTPTFTPTFTSTPDLNLCTQNLIVNSDFEAGNTGFASEYTYSPGNIFPPRVYDVVDDPSKDHSSGARFGDHTTGSGKMMAVNGATTLGPIVWTQTAFQPNTDYGFSAWVASWYFYLPAQLQFSINGTVVGTFKAPSTVGSWQQSKVIWNSGSAHRPRSRSPI